MIGLAVGGLLTAFAPWAPFVLAAVGMPLLEWPTVRWLPVTVPRGSHRRASPSLRFYAAAAIRPGVRALLAAEVLWVIGYAALPVFFILYAQRVLGLDPARASLWLAVFAVAAGAVMVAAGLIRRPRLHKPLLGLGGDLDGDGLPVCWGVHEPRVGFARVRLGGRRVRAGLDAGLLPSSQQ